MTGNRQPQCNYSSEEIDDGFNVVSTLFYVVYRDFVSIVRVVLLRSIHSQRSCDVLGKIKVDDVVIKYNHTEQI